MLPTMQSDILLSDGTRTLIIDAKYYSQNVQRRFDRETVRSANLYQIFTYAENRAARHPGNVPTECSCTRGRTARSSPRPSGTSMVTTFR